MSDAENAALKILVDEVRKIREDQVESGKTLAVVKATTDRTEAAVGVLQAEMLTVQGQARKALAQQHEHQRAAEARPDAPGWWWRATPQAIAARYPARALLAVLIMCSAWVWGPMVALRILAVTAGVPPGVIPPAAAGGS